jgi:hypothetical protein
VIRLRLYKWRGCGEDKPKEKAKAAPAKNGADTKAKEAPKAE